MKKKCEHAKEGGLIQECIMKDEIDCKDCPVSAKRIDWDLMPPMGEEPVSDAPEDTCANCGIWSLSRSKCTETRHGTTDGNSRCSKWEPESPTNGEGTTEPPEWIDPDHDDKAERKHCGGCLIDNEKLETENKRLEGEVERLKTTSNTACRITNATTEELEKLKSDLATMTEYRDAWKEKTLDYRAKLEAMTTARDHTFKRAEENEAKIADLTQQLEAKKDCGECERGNGITEAYIISREIYYAFMIGYGFTDEGFDGDRAEAMEGRMQKLVGMLGEIKDA